MGDRSVHHVAPVYKEAAKNRLRSRGYPFPAFDSCELYFSHFSDYSSLMYFLFTAPYIYPETSSTTVLVCAPVGMCLLCNFEEEFGEIPGANSTKKWLRRCLKVLSH